MKWLIGKEKMNRIKILLTVTACISLIATTGCSTSLPTESVALVTDEEFKKAVKRLKGTNDEYDGSLTMQGKGDSVVNFTDGYGYVGMYPILLNDAKASTWDFSLVGHLYNNEWLFMDSIGIKSTKGRFVVYLSNPKRDVQTLGYISEIGSALLDSSEIENFCEVMKGKNVTFKLSGDQGFIERKVTKTMIFDSIAVCKVAEGLEQGREVSIG